MACELLQRQVLVAGAGRWAAGCIVRCEARVSECPVLMLCCPAALPPPGSNGPASILCWLCNCGAAVACLPGCVALGTDAGMNGSPGMLQRMHNRAAVTGKTAPVWTWPGLQT